MRKDLDRIMRERGLAGTVAFAYDRYSPVMHYLTGQKLHYGVYFRAPGAAELFTWGFDDGSQEFQEGNPALKVEHSFNIDLALRIHARNWKAEAGGFFNAISNYIYMRPTDRDTLLADVGSMQM